MAGCPLGRMRRCTGGRAEARPSAISRSTRSAAQRLNTEIWIAILPDCCCLIRINAGPSVFSACMWGEAHETLSDCGNSIGLRRRRRIGRHRSDRRTTGADETRRRSREETVRHVEREAPFDLAAVKESRRPSTKGRRKRRPSPTTARPAAAPRRCRRSGKTRRTSTPASPNSKRMSRPPRRELSMRRRSRNSPRRSSRIAAAATNSTRPKAVET